jgi:hypothetical protein
MSREADLVLSRSLGRFKASGLEPGDLGPRTAHLFEIDRGKVTTLTYYFDRGHALTDLGLAPESGIA